MRPTVGRWYIDKWHMTCQSYECDERGPDRATPIEAQEAYLALGRAMEEDE